MKRSIAIDAIADQELAAADQMMSALQSTAPGTAEMIGAQAGAWLVRSHAYTQQAMAELMRVRAIELAGESARVKGSCPVHARDSKQADRAEPLERSQRVSLRANVQHRPERDFVGGLDEHDLDRCLRDSPRLACCSRPTKPGRGEATFERLACRR